MAVVHPAALVVTEGIYSNSAGVFMTIRIPEKTWEHDGAKDVKMKTTSGGDITFSELASSYLAPGFWDTMEVESPGTIKVPNSSQPCFTNDCTMLTATPTADAMDLDQVSSSSWNGKQHTLTDSIQNAQKDELLIENKTYSNTRGVEVSQTGTPSITDFAKSFNAADFSEASLPFHLISEDDFVANQNHTIGRHSATIETPGATENPIGREVSPSKEVSAKEDPDAKDIHTINNIPTIEEAPDEKGAPATNEVSSVKKAAARKGQNRAEEVPVSLRICSNESCREDLTDDKAWMDAFKTPLHDKEYTKIPVEERGSRPKNCRPCSRYWRKLKQLRPPTPESDKICLNDACGLNISEKDSWERAEYAEILSATLQGSRPKLCVTCANHFKMHRKFRQPIPRAKGTRSKVEKRPYKRSSGKKHPLKQCSGKNGPPKRFGGKKQRDHLRKVN